MSIIRTFTMSPLLKDQPLKISTKVHHRKLERVEAAESDVLELCTTRVYLTSQWPTTKTNNTILFHPLKRAD